MLTTEQLLQSLEASRLIGSDELAQLRAKFAERPQQFTAPEALRWLIGQGSITPAQAERLSGGPLAPEGESSSAVEPSASAPAAEDELTLAPLDDEPPRTVSKSTAVPNPSAAAKTPSASKSPSAPKPAAKPTVKPAAQPAADATTQSADSPEADRSLLDELMDDPALARSAGLTATATGSSAAGGALGQQVRKRSARRSWDSPLLLGSGTLLLVLALIGGALWWALGREASDDSLRAAEADYQAGSYELAVRKFNQFLASYPEHSAASRVKVQRGMARLRQVVDAGNWPQGLAVAQATLKEIEAETDFHLAHGELAAMLPSIAEGLAQQAEQTGTAEQIAAGRAALELAQTDRYLLPNLRPTLRLLEVEQQLARAARGSESQAALAKTLAQLAEAAAGPRPVEGLRLRAELLARYPELRDNVELRRAVSQATAALARSVTVVRAPTPLPAVVVDDVASSVRILVFAPLETAPTGAASSGNTLVCLVDAVAYGLDAASAEVLWRRYLGGGDSWQPVAVATDPQADCLLVDARHNEVMRIERRSGRVIWRTRCERPLVAPPLVSHQSVWVVGRQGLLVALELDSGQPRLAVELPQTVWLPPTLDSRATTLYVLAEEANLYALDATSGECRAVHYLGHEAGRVLAAPCVLGHYLAIAENHSPTGGLLRVFDTLSADAPMTQVQLHAYEGNVRSPLLAGGRTLALATDQAAVQIFEAAANRQPPLEVVAQRPAERGEPVVQFLTSGQGKLYVAGRGLTCYDAQAARGRLVPQWLAARDDILRSAAQQVVSGDLFFTSASTTQPGQAVALVKAVDGQPRWRSRLAVPLLAVRSGNDPMATEAAASQIDVVNQSGMVLRGSLAGSEPLVAVTTRGVQLPLAGLIEPWQVAKAGDELLAIGAGEAVTTRGTLFVVPADKLDYRAIGLPVPLRVVPVPLAGGWLMPTESGQVLHLDLQGNALSEPFQPRLALGTRLNWSRPLVLGDSEALLDDGQGNLFRLAVVREPVSHLVAQARATLPSAQEQMENDIHAASNTLANDLAMARVKESLFVADRAGRLWRLRLPGLELEPPVELDGPVVWGPVACGDLVLVATADGQPQTNQRPAQRWEAVDALGQRLWQYAFDGDHPIGRPLADPSGSGVWLATAEGRLWRGDLSSGQFAVAVELAEPLAAGPWRLDEKHLLVATPDGALLVVGVP